MTPSLRRLAWLLGLALAGCAAPSAQHASTTGPADYLYLWTGSPTTRNLTFLATFHTRHEGGRMTPGGIVELTPAGGVVRASSADGPDERHGRPHGGVAQPPGLAPLGAEAAQHVSIA